MPTWKKGMVALPTSMSCVRPKAAKRPWRARRLKSKNMNSFRRGVRRALEYEIPRQIETLKKGGKLFPGKRAAGMTLAAVTEVMRTKEQAHDYR